MLRLIRQLPAATQRALASIRIAPPIGCDPACVAELPLAASAAGALHRMSASSSVSRRFGLQAEGLTTSDRCGDHSQFGHCVRAVGRLDADSGCVNNLCGLRGTTTLLKHKRVLHELVASLAANVTHLKVRGFPPSLKWRLKRCPAKNGRSPVIERAVCTLWGSRSLRRTCGQSVCVSAGHAAGMAAALAARIATSPRNVDIAVFQEIRRK